MDTRNRKTAGGEAGPTVSLDLDDVLVDIMDLYLEELMQITGLAFTREDVRHYDTTRLITPDGRSPSDEQVRELIESLATRRIYRDAPPYEAGLAMCRRLAELGFELIINTARRAMAPSLQKRIEEDTRYWLDRHFPSGLFRAVEFTHYNPDGKMEVCRQHHCLAHVEDAWHHVEAMIGQPSLLPVLLEAPHNRYAWDQTTPCPPADDLHLLEKVFKNGHDGLPVICVKSHDQIPPLLNWYVHRNS